MQSICLKCGMQKMNFGQNKVMIRDTLNIGVMAITGQLSDIAEVRRGIVRVIREFPQTRLVVTGDADAYRLFDNLPEGKTCFLSGC